MRIQSISPEYYNKAPNFGGNINSPLLKFKKKDFYVNIRGYGRIGEWAKKMAETADKAVNVIINSELAENVLKIISFGVREANQIPADITKREASGFLRIKREGWKTFAGVKESNDSFLYTKYDKSRLCRYRKYNDRLDKTVIRPLKNPYKNFMLTRPLHDDYGKTIIHANSIFLPEAFNKIEKIYANLRTNYVLKDVKEENLGSVNNSVAEIRWILAHATPWFRGSDAISNVFMRSLYKSMGIKTYPLKRGVSLDLEAYCTNLGDYQKNFSGYFKKTPKIVE